MPTPPALSLASTPSPGIENPEEWVREAKAALKGIRKIIDNSDGDLAGWCNEFDDLVGDIDAVLAKTTADDPGHDPRPQMR